jgi:hypothetical protein
LAVLSKTVARKKYLIVETLGVTYARRILTPAFSANGGKVMSRLGAIILRELRVVILMLDPIRMHVEDVLQLAPRVLPVGVWIAQYQAYANAAIRQMDTNFLGAFAVIREVASIRMDLEDVRRAARSFRAVLNAKQNLNVRTVQNVLLDITRMD